MEQERKPRRLLDRPLAQRMRQRYPGTWAFLGRRFSRDEYLGLHLTLGMLLSLALLGLFAAMAHHVIGDTRLTNFDQEVGLALEDFRQGRPFITGLFGALTQLGNMYTLAGLAAVIAFLLWRRRQRLLMLVWITALVGAGLLDAGLKLVFDRSRPDFYDRVWVHETTPSFPSGHSTAGLVAYGLLVYLFVLGLSRRRARWAVPALVLLVLAIGFSRMYLGAHYFSDVVGGFLLGSCWLAVVISAIEVVRRWRKQRRAAGGANGTALPPAP